MTKVSFPDNCLSMQKIILHKINDSTKHLWPGYTLLQIFCLSSHWQGAISTSFKENSYLGVLVYCFHDPAESRKGYLIKTISRVWLVRWYSNRSLSSGVTVTPKAEHEHFSSLQVYISGIKKHFSLCFQNQFLLLTRSCNSRNTVFPCTFPLSIKLDKIKISEIHNHCICFLECKYWSLFRFLGFQRIITIVSLH